MRFHIAFILTLTSTFFSAQIPGRPGSADLNSDSSTIIIGAARDQFNVMRESKASHPETQLPNGNVIQDLPDMREVWIGKVFAVTVEEVLKNDRRVKKVRIVYVFTADRSAHAPILPSDERVLLFLRPISVEDAGHFAGAYIILRDGRRAKLPVNPNSIYEVVRGRIGLVSITDNNADIIDQIRSTIRQTK